MQRVRSTAAAGAPAGRDPQRHGYIVAAHKIELASKVMGKVAWIGVDKGDRVKQGQELVRLEDDEYRAQLAQARGALANLEAKLAESHARLAAGGDRAGAAPMWNRRGPIWRMRASRWNAPATWPREGVLAKQNLDDAQAKYDSGAGHG